MNRKRPGALKCFCVGVLLGMLLAGCHGLQSSEAPLEDGKRTEAHLAFSHDDHHDEAIDRRGLDCEDCHLLVEEELTEELSDTGRQSCHGCHIKGPEQVTTALKCMNCHGANMHVILPADHRPGWVSRHGTGIGLSKVACRECHSNRFCVRCHMRRDTADPAFHRGSALVTHPIQARADPSLCAKCHQASYCTRCHSAGRF